MALNKPLGILIFVLIVAFVLLFLFSGVNYVPYDNKKQKYSVYEPMTVSSTKEKEKEKEKEEDSTKTEPFIPKTIQYGPLRDSEIIDKFSQVTANGQDGVNGCVSSGLSNSKGQICLTPDLIQLLKTRGGNATGGECLEKYK